MMGRLLLAAAIMAQLASCDPGLVLVEEPAVEAPTPVVVSWFESVDDSLITAFDPTTWDAFNAYAVQRPPAPTEWVLQVEIGPLWLTLKHDTASAGNRAGHRWYIMHDQEARLRMIAWGEHAPPDTAHWTHNGGQP